MGDLVHQSQSSRGGAVGEGACLPFPTNSFRLCSHLSHSIPPETKDSSACITKNDWSSPDPTENVQRKRKGIFRECTKGMRELSWDPTGQAPETIPQVLPRLSPVSLEFLGGRDSAWFSCVYGTQTWDSNSASPQEWLSGHCFHHVIVSKCQCRV